jgi:hypothetical protein
MKDLGIITINLQVTNKRGKPCLVLRKNFTDTEIIKNIVSSAWHDQSIVVIPIFEDKVKGLNSLIKNGVLYKDKENGQYKFVQ